ncbi:hypothetical protein E4U53_001180 [Claviceps sorghi]|nr:hypothetical protein E4U53_001180 [Claviceps sorghi]
MESKVCHYPASRSSSQDAEGNFAASAFGHNLDVYLTSGKFMGAPGAMGASPVRSGVRHTPRSANRVVDGADSLSQSTPASIGFCQKIAHSPWSKWIAPMGKSCQDE